MRDLARDLVWEALLPEKRFDDIEDELDLITHVRAPGGIRARFLATDPIPEASSVEPNLEDAYLYLLRHGNGNPDINVA